MSKAWMPLYIGDYLRDTQHLTCTQHGAYLLLIMHYWEHGGLPKDDEAIARISRLNRDQWRSNSLAIASLFEPGWRHKRVDIELAKAKQLSDKRAVIGAAGGRHNRGRNNAQRSLQKGNGEAIAKQTVAHNHSHKEEEVGEKEFGNPKHPTKMSVATSALETIIRAKGWHKPKSTKTTG